MCSHCGWDYEGDEENDMEPKMPVTRQEYLKAGLIFVGAFLGTLLIGIALIELALRKSYHP